MMPEMDGYEVCRRIRGFSAVPILFLTGRGAEDDKIDGLTSGGDDYIVKSYSLRAPITAIRSAVDYLRLIDHRTATLENLVQDMYYLFCVEDTSRALQTVTPDAIPKLFHRTFTVSSAHTPGSPTGSGLGLAIAQAITRRHGGSIRCESTPGKGSCFTATLPCTLTEL